MNLRPLGDRVIVKAEEAEETTSSGLYIAHEKKEKPQNGIVVAVGEGALGEDGKPLPMPVKVGDKVVFAKFGGTNVSIGGEELIILRSDDLFAVFE